MKITEIKPQKGHLFKITADEKEFFLDRDYLNESGLKVGSRLDGAEIKEHIKKSEYVRAKSRALWFLDRADRSEKTLFAKIVDGNISPAAAAEVIERFKELGLVDDKRYAENLAEKYLSQNFSKRQVYAKIVSKGVPSAVVNEVLKETETDEVAQIKSLIEKKYKTKIDTKENTQKTVAALMRRGFNYSAVRDALKEYKLELEYEEF